MDKDGHIIYESYTKSLEEGIFDRMKAKGAGLAQSVGGLKNTASRIAGGAKAAVGSAIGNTNMVNQGSQQVQSAQQQAATRTTGADVKASSINTSFTSKIDKELMNFNTRLSKSLNVTDPQQLLASLEAAAPDMAELFTSIQEITNQIKSQPVQSQPAQAQPAQPQASQGQPGGERVTVQTKKGPQQGTKTGANVTPGHTQVKLDSGAVFAFADNMVQSA